MTAYYNEIENDAADCLEQLIREGIIPYGVVDRRSIKDVRATDVRGFTQCHWFAGSGGWPYAFRLAGWPDWRSGWSGSCPCQPFSVAGEQRGFADDRDLWPAWFDLIRQCSPPIIFGEQVTSAPLWIERLYSDLESADFAIGSADLPAASVGAKHGRPRFWFVANSQRHQQPWQEPCGRPAGRVGREQQSISWDEPWQGALSRFRVLGDGLRRSVGATDAARNAIVPQVAAQFIIAAGEAMTALSPAQNQVLENKEGGA
jgi:DNA (cytosine-5)-methyltransferase 1